MAAKTYSIAEVADMIDVTPRTIRKVLRANIAKDAQPGRGARWSIAEKDVKKLTELCEAFNARANVIADLGD